MLCKSVLCILGTDECDRDIMNAINICNEVNAHLSVLIVGSTPVPVLADPWTKDREAAVDAIKTHEERIRSLAIGYGVSANVEICYIAERWADEIIGERARYSDLTIVGADLLRQADLKTLAIDWILFHSRSPILILPADMRPTLRPRKVLFASGCPDGSNAGRARCDRYNGRGRGGSCHRQRSGRHHGSAKSRPPRQYRCLPRTSWCEGNDQSPACWWARRH